MSEFEESYSAWVAGNYKASIPVIKDYAEHGNVKAQVTLGNAYLSGSWGVEYDPIQAKYWFERAAGSGSPHAFLNLALMLDPGNEQIYENIKKNCELSSQNYRKAFVAYQRGAESGDADLMFGLSNCYAAGWGTEMDIEKAQYWRTKAIASGFDMSRIAEGSSGV